MSLFPEAAVIDNRLYGTALFEDFVSIIRVCGVYTYMYVVGNLWLVTLWFVRVSSASGSA